MPSLSEKIFPELARIDAGAERRRVLQDAVNRPWTHAAALIVVVCVTALFVLWDKLVASISSNWTWVLLSTLYPAGLWVTIWLTRREVRRALRAHLASKGVPICIPCGYDLTGNESGRCPECGMPVSAVAAPPGRSVTAGESYQVDRESVQSISNTDEK